MSKEEITKHIFDELIKWNREWYGYVHTKHSGLTGGPNGLDDIGYVCGTHEEWWSTPFCDYHYHECGDPQHVFKFGLFTLYAENYRIVSYDTVVHKAFRKLHVLLKTLFSVRIKILTMDGKITILCDSRIYRNKWEYRHNFKIYRL